MFNEQKGAANSAEENALPNLWIRFRGYCGVYGKCKDAKFIPLKTGEKRITKLRGAMKFHEYLSLSTNKACLLHTDIWVSVLVEKLNVRMKVLRENLFFFFFELGCGGGG